MNDYDDIPEVEEKHVGYAVLAEKISHSNHNINNLNKRVDTILDEEKITGTRLDELKIEVERFKTSAIVARSISGGLLFVIGGLIIQLYSQNLEWNKTQDAKLDTIQSYIQVLDSRVSKIEYEIDQKK